MTGVIDFSQPVAVLFVAVLHGISDKADPAGIVRTFAARMSPGSYLTVSHLTSEGHGGSAESAARNYQIPERTRCLPRYHR